MSRSPIELARLHLPLTVRQGGAFAAIGVLATAVHVTAALAAQAYLGAAPLYANMIGYGTAVGVSYLGNAWLTFRRPVRDAPQMARFAAVSLAGLALSQAITWLVVHKAGRSLQEALIPTVVIIPVFSFAMSKFWAFAFERAPAK